MDSVVFAQKLFYSWLERIFRRGGEGGEGELGGMEGAIQRGDVVELRKRHFLSCELVGPEGGDVQSLVNASGREMRVGPGGGLVTVKGGPVALRIHVSKYLDSP